MESPDVSVIMPVYNAEKYVQRAIDSILAQTFTNFEFIIVDDGSTDRTRELIENYTDARIRYLKQVSRQGVVAAMNRGLADAKSAFIAVMHADDISFPHRLALQYNYLKEFDTCAAIAGKTIFIDEHDQETKETWKLDDETQSYRAIKSVMVKENCITHSTVMMRTEVARMYTYESAPQHKGYAVEDYPLWLNILSDGNEIHKLKDKVLYYRTHNTSATITFLRNNNPFLVNYYTKNFYLQTRRKYYRITTFDKKVELWMYIDYLKAILKNMKKRLSR